MKIIIICSQKVQHYYSELDKTKSEYDIYKKNIKTHRRNRKIIKKLQQPINCRCLKGKNCWNGNENNNCSHGYKFNWIDSDSEKSDTDTMYAELKPQNI